jgi:hypothetical protein
MTALPPFHDSPTFRPFVAELEPATVALPAYVTFSERRPLLPIFSQ